MSTGNTLTRSGELELTGERWVFEKMHPDRTTHDQHLARYTFALRYVYNFTVLDASSGAGYGTYLMRSMADFVFGLDNSWQAIAYARQMYNTTPGLGVMQPSDFRDLGRDNFSFCVADVQELPFAADSFQAVVSFETIEHISGYIAFLREVRRVLQPGGLFLVSTPNRAIREKGIGGFHKQEWLIDEFKNLLAPYFTEADWFGQLWDGRIKQPFTDLDTFILGVLR